MFDELIKNLQADLSEFLGRQRSQGVALESPEAVNQLLQWLLTRVDVVPRGEFDAQIKLLDRAMERVEDLEQRLDTLEKIANK